MPTYDDIFTMDPQNLVTWLHEEFYVELPEKIESTTDMELASELLLQLSSQYSYLAELLSYAKIAVRKAKRSLPKEEWEDMVDRKEVIERRLDIAKQQYTAVSRAVTVKTEANKELLMGGGQF